MLEKLTAGDFLYREGDANDCAYIVAEGNIVLFSGDGDRRRVIERRGSGSIVGEVSILRGVPRAVSVVAETDCIVFRISAEQIATRFAALDPLMMACIETTIGFIESVSRPADVTTPPTPAKATNLEELIDRLRLECDLTDGLDRGEFHMVYQPIIDTVGARIAGFEALMRWTHPSLGNVAPNHFIAVAEEMGSVCKLTDFAIRHACKALEEFRAQTGRDDLFVAVNVTAGDLLRDDFVDYLGHVLDMHNLAPADIKIELTESALVPSAPIVEDNLSRLKVQGYGVSVDDFGTGYSNLGHLQLLPLTALKIDRVFAHGAHQNKINLGIIRMLIALAQELKVDVIAEGLEDAADVAALASMGCRYFQGFHFYRPMRFDDAIKVLGEAEERSA